MRLKKEEYDIAKKCLIHYKYNLKKLKDIRDDIIDIGSPKLDGLPKAKYSNSNTVLATIIKLENDKELQKVYIEYNAVNQALDLINKDCEDLFKLYYYDRKSKYDVIETLNISKRTYERRKKELIYAVFREYQKNLKKFSKNS